MRADEKLAGGVEERVRLEDKKCVLKWVKGGDGGKGCYGIEIVDEDGEWWGGSGMMWHEEWLKREVEGVCCLWFVDVEQVLLDHFILVTVMTGSQVSILSDPPSFPHFIHLLFWALKLTFR